jgi:hypothetical protein
MKLKPLTAALILTTCTSYLNCAPVPPLETIPIFSLEPVDLSIGGYDIPIIGNVLGSIVLPVLRPIVAPVYNLMVSGEIL